MSKQIKELVVREYQRRFEGVEGGVLVEVRGLDAGTNTACAPRWSTSRSA